MVLGVTIVLCCLANRNGGLIGTLDFQVCIMKVSENSVNCTNELEIIVSYKLMHEYIFKLALIKRKYDNVMSMIRN